MPKKNQITIFILCWIAYASVYFGRVNLAIAAHDIQNFLHISNSQIGLLGTVFFWIYGTGQLINGHLGDKIISYKIIFIGLLITGAANLFFGFAASFIVMLVIWSINGYFQSMLWGPIVRTLSERFDEHMISKISVGISTSMVFGYILAWGVSGELTVRAGWKWAFFVPGIFILAYSIIWLYKIKKLLCSEFESESNKSSSCFSDKITGNNKAVPAEKISMYELVIKRKLWLVACTCMTQGFIKDSISLWAPIFIMERNNIDLSALPGVIIIIPVINFLGLMLAGWLNKKTKNEKVTIAILFLVCIFMLLLLKNIKNMPVILFVLITGGMSGAMFGANSMLLGAIPMKYAKYGRASSTAGFFDFCSYIAAGISASVIGFISNASGWSAVILVWIFTAAAGIILILISRYYDNAEINNKNTLKLISDKLN